MPRPEPAAQGVFVTARLHLCNARKTQRGQRVGVSGWSSRLLLCCPCPGGVGQLRCGLPGSCGMRRLCSWILLLCAVLGIDPRALHMLCEILHCSHCYPGSCYPWHYLRLTITGPHSVLHGKYSVHCPSLTAKATLGLLGKMDSFMKSASISAQSRLSINTGRTDANSGGAWQVQVVPQNTLDFPRHFMVNLKLP